MASLFAFGVAGGRLVVVIVVVALPVGVFCVFSFRLGFSFSLRFVSVVFLVLLAAFCGGFVVILVGLWLAACRLVFGGLVVGLV